jgi:hypothetical protein
MYGHHNYRRKLRLTCALLARADTTRVVEATNLSPQTVALLIII